MKRAPARAGALSLVAVLLMLSAGCGEHRSLLAPNDGPPVLRLEARPSGVASATVAGYRIQWTTESGRADHYLYAVNPASVGEADATWISTGSTSYDIAVPRGRAALSPSREGRRAVTFAVIAVDREGRHSAVKYLSFVDGDLAPVAYILTPAPSGATPVTVGASVDVSWAVAGYFTPVTQSKYKLFGPGSEFPVATALANPDSLRSYYEARGYAGWDSTGVCCSSAKLSGLAHGEYYLFVVVAEDANGTYTQYLSPSTNMLYMRCVPLDAPGPTLTLYNSHFTYTYASGTYSTDPRYQVPLTTLAREPVTVNWVGQPLYSAGIAAYRWALDIADVFDDTPRLFPHDFRHWSRPSPNTVSATVGPFAAGETHVLYIEATDTNGLKSLGMVRIQTLEGLHPARDLLIVNDTRFVPDERLPSQSCVRPPVGRWPTAAELDTFLFAQGGFPWRCYPAGTFSSPGLFKGYSFDTIGTRGLGGTGLVPLGVLSQYRHVVWITDARGALMTGVPMDPSSPITALRLMSGVGQQNLLATYIENGGEVWLVGGGGAVASLIPWNNPANDRVNPTMGITFTNSAGELVPGRMMYSEFHWQSGITATNSRLTIARSLGRLDEHPLPGSWRMREERVLPYHELPAALSPKSLAAGDTFPPNRSPILDDFYRTSFELEYLFLPNSIVEDRMPGPHTWPVSTLDTLYAATGAALVPPAFNPVDVAMTYYHGADNPPAFFSGFDIWSFQRVQCRALVDFVLQRTWGLSRSPTLVAKQHEPGPWPPGRPIHHEAEGD
jgi:hypothetical protein